MQNKFKMAEERVGKQSAWEIKELNKNIYMFFSFSRWRQVARLCATHRSQTTFVFMFLYFKTPPGTWNHQTPVTRRWKDVLRPHPRRQIKRKFSPLKLWQRFPAVWSLLLHRAPPSSALSYDATSALHCGTTTLFAARCCAEKSALVPKRALQGIHSVIQ